MNIEFSWQHYSHKQIWINPSSGSILQGGTQPFSIRHFRPSYWKSILPQPLKPQIWVPHKQWIWYYNPSCDCMCHKTLGVVHDTLWQVYLLLNCFLSMGPGVVGNLFQHRKICQMLPYYAQCTTIAQHEPGHEFFERSVTFFSTWGTNSNYLSECFAVSSALAIIQFITGFAVAFQSNLGGIAKVVAMPSQSTTFCLNDVEVFSKNNIL